MRQFQEEIAIKIFSEDMDEHTPSPPEEESSEESKEKIRPIDLPDLWTVTYVRVDDAQEGPEHVYRTYEEAIDAAIVDYGYGELYKDKSGRAFYYCDHFMAEPMLLDDVRELVQETGEFNCRDPNNMYDLVRYCIISYVSVEEERSINVKALPRKVRINGKYVTIPI
uniref:Uncharacterized protein n=1 Tax=Pithovirus LCPAC304 TaxID=2506594 RepID=A0A481Z8M3_9VIRU|nr:MAG: hypothetical protein LCPAC304_02880 [Pithovirus LCPAC304]